MLCLVLAQIKGCPTNDWNPSGMAYLTDMANPAEILTSSDHQPTLESTSFLRAGPCAVAEDGPQHVHIRFEGVYKFTANSHSKTLQTFFAFLVNGT